MIKKDDILKSVIKQNTELRNQIINLQKEIMDIQHLQFEAENKGYWNEGYCKHLYKKFLLTVSFGIEHMNNYIDDSIEDLKNTQQFSLVKDLVFNKNSQLPN